MYWTNWNALKMSMWNRIDTSENKPFYLSPEDECYFAREYTAGKGYSFSKANNLILNLKKPMSKKGTNEFQHKINAVNQFATELAELLDGIADNAAIMAVPCSKRKDHQLFDPRNEAVVELLKKKLPQIEVIEPITRSVNVEPLHMSVGKRADPDQIMKSLDCVELKTDREIIVVVDDVITNGAHFVAVRRMLQKQNSEMRVIGAFWAKTVWANTVDEDE